MQDDTPRYAIYFVPSAESRLYRFGSAVLGYDCYTGADVALPDELKPDAGAWRRLTEEPRRYGFHATLKAPFHLSPACTEQQLISALVSFLGLGHRVVLIAPEVRTIGGFAAVVPRKPSASIAALANQCTTMFDAFRAPMSPRERARRVAANLSQSQMHNLERWGYPYLFEDFRFHMTLTGKVTDGRQDQIVAALRQSFDRMCKDQSIVVDRLTLLRQDHGHAPFRVIRQAEFGQ